MIQALKHYLLFSENNKEELEKLKTTCGSGSKPNVPFWLNASAYLATLYHFYNNVQARKYTIKVNGFFLYYPLSRLCEIKI